jgi:MYXO-CTERM domain-containing protein
VRVTTTGASPTLPLRMVAVGTGALTPITLWVLAEGRYDTVNLPSFQIDQSQLVWDWDTQSSNYAALKQAGFAKTNNTGWVVEDAEPFSMFELQEQLSYLVDSDPADSGYEDPTGMTTASQSLADDMTTLFASIPASSVWITRFEGVISRAALSADLQIAAASDQSQVSRYLQATQQTGTAPTCPAPAPCDSGNGGDSSGSSGNGGSGTASGAPGCATSSGDAGGALFGGAGLVLALAFAHRRRPRRSRSIPLARTGARP